MHVAFPSKTVKGAIVVADVLEGLAMVLTNSGTVNGFETDVPNAELADANTNPVYIVAAAPDNFPRPVDSRQYRAGWYTTLGRDEADYSEPVETVTQYKVGISNLYNPTIPSGYLVNLHRGGTYTVPADCYTDSADIRVPGNYIVVGSNGKWAYSASRTNAVGEVVRYNADTEELTFDLWF